MYVSFVICVQTPKQNFPEGEGEVKAKTHSVVGGGWGGGGGGANMNMGADRLGGPHRLL